jgi:hypothetical protein
MHGSQVRQQPRRVWTNRRQPALLTAVTLALSALAYSLLPIPFLWIGLIWSVALLSAIACLSRPWYPPLVLLFLNASVIALVFGAAELVFFRREAAPVYSAGYGYEDDVLGYVPVKGVRGHSSKIENGKPLFDVTYSIDSNGQRVAPAVNQEGPSACVLFFGDSFTFGEGLEDSETLPYQVGVQSNGRVQTYNFGFHGYGPHQMLSAIEHGIVRDRVRCKPDFAIYQALPDHAARVSGKITYAKHAPRYRLQTDGSVRYAGHFDDEVPPWQQNMQGRLGKSAIYRWLQAFTLPVVSDDDVRLMLGVVRSSGEQLAQQYPGIRFQVILWINRETDKTVYDELRRGLDQMKIPTHLVEEILPDYRLGASEYVLSGIDRHPTALTDRLLAAYVVNRIVKSSSEGTPRGKPASSNN